MVRPSSKAVAMTIDTSLRRLHPVRPDNAVLLLVDQQEGLFSRIHEPEHTRRNLVPLARCARILQIPVVLTTALANGPNGQQLKELTDAAPTPSGGGEEAPHALDRQPPKNRV